MNYIAVIGVIKDKNGVQYQTVCVDTEANSSNWSVIGGVVNMNDSMLAMTVAKGITPVNFSIDREGKVRQDCGDFNRFSKKGSAVVLAELKSRSGRSLGYKLLGVLTGAVVNMKTAEIIKREEAYGDEHFLQNGIVRNGTINCYPRKPFPVITLDDKKSTSIQKPTMVHQKPKQEVKQEIKKPDQPKKVHTADEFTPEQLAEINKCMKAGVNSRLIKNPELKPSQMRVLWVSKSKGALAEKFNNPKLSVEAMKFYADRIYDKKTAEECADMLAHPELSVDELNELYACACAGVPYSEYIGKSATDIQVARDMKTQEYWGSSSKFDVDYYDKALNVAMKMKGY